MPLKASSAKMAARVDVGRELGGASPWAQSHIEEARDLNL